jgi:hypothetical protein
MRETAACVKRLASEELASLDSYGRLFLPLSRSSKYDFSAMALLCSVS